MCAVSNCLTIDQVTFPAMAAVVAVLGELVSASYACHHSWLLDSLAAFFITILVEGFCYTRRTHTSLSVVDSPTPNLCSPSQRTHKSYSNFCACSGRSPPTPSSSDGEVAQLNPDITIRISQVPSHDAAKNIPKSKRLQPMASIPSLDENDC